MKNTRRLPTIFAIALGLAIVEQTLQRATLAQRDSPAGFRVDALWPKMPPKWILGQVGGVAVDSRDHVFVLQRPWSLETDEKALNPDAACCFPAPPLMEFDADGNYIQGWGGPSPDYEWPMDEHGLHIDYKDNIWITSAGGPRLKERKENQILKFTRSGKFLLQIGRRGMSKGSLDPENLNNAAGVAVYPKTNEVFVADGYVNRRVIVFDADSGTFKRMWGAYGNAPDDTVSRDLQYEGPGAPQFNTVHGVAVSNDGVVYVADRRNNRVQLFTIDGKFLREIFVERSTRLLGTAFSVAFSPDPAQRHAYLADAGNGRVHVFDRTTMQVVGGFGRIGHYAGEFVFLHAVTADSRGNLYTAEVGGGRRVQKFVKSQ
jgi:DNA-binding beta-propeller fold protein YncE